MAISADEHDRRLHAYHDTVCDADAAQGLGLAYGTYRAWRRRVGLPIKVSPFADSRLDAEENQRRMDVWERTGSDEEAANTLGLLRTTFQSWRKVRGLANKRTGCKPGEGVLSPQEERRRLDAWAGSATFREAARRLGIAPQSMETWAKRRGIPPPATKITAGRIGYTDYELTLWQAFCTSLNDLESSTRAGIGQNAMRRWRMRRGFPSHRRDAAYWQRLRQEAARGNPVADFYVRKRFPRTHGLDEPTELDDEEAM